MKLLFTGDIMPGGVLPYQTEWVSDRLLKFLKNFDLRIGTLECSIGDNFPFDEIKMNGKMNIIYSPEKELERVKTLGFDVVTLANNHVFDLGKDGFQNTIKMLDDIGISHCGVGMNIEEASRPAIVQVRGKRLAFLAYCQYGSKYIGHVPLASSDEPGINPLDIHRCLSDIRKAKTEYDYVFVMPHWGIEYQYLPTPECRKMAYQMIEAGADGVFASHTHKIQPLISYLKRPIAFSMGNFMFPDYLMTPPRPIWYPDKSYDFSKLKHFKFYPDNIDKPCVQEWNHLSRVGMAIVYQTKGNSVDTSYFLTYLNKENIIDFYNKPANLKRRMKWMGVFTKTFGYGFNYKLYNSRWNVLRRGYHFVTRPFTTK